MADSIRVAGDRKNEILIAYIGEMTRPNVQISMVGGVAELHPTAVPSEDLFVSS